MTPSSIDADYFSGSLPMASKASQSRVLSRLEKISASPPSPRSFNRFSSFEELATSKTKASKNVESTGYGQMDHLSDDILRLVVEDE